MRPEKLKKIEAVLNDPASTENEKDICRGLLDKHPMIAKVESYEPGMFFKFSPTVFTGKIIINGVLIVPAEDTRYCHTCEQCKNNFMNEKVYSVYCDLCLAALKRKAGE